MNNMDAYKVGIVNAFAMLLSFSAIEDVLKIILLLVSIVYTIFKIIEIIKRNSSKDKIN